jgi:hypothetical protein
MVRRHYNVRVYIEEVTEETKVEAPGRAAHGQVEPRRELEMLNYKTQTNSLNTALERVQKVLELHTEEAI